MFSIPAICAMRSSRSPIPFHESRAALCIALMALARSGFAATPDPPQPNADQSGGANIAFGASQTPRRHSIC